MARRADAPVHDLGFVDDKAVVLVGLKTGCRAHGAVDVDRDEALTTDQMVMVVTNTRFVKGGATGGLDSANDPGGRERVEIVVNGLARKASQPFSSRLDDELRVLMLAFVLDDFQHGQARRRQAEVGGFQEVFDLGSHLLRLPHYLYCIQIMTYVSKISLQWRQAAMRKSLFDRMGREDGCRRLSHAFYSRVANEPILRPLFPGKSLRCATEEFAAFLIQFFGGEDEQSQYRWWLSLRQSHARFRIEESQRLAWLGLMDPALRETFCADEDVAALLDFFRMASLYLIGEDAGPPAHPELATLWQRQLRLEKLMSDVANGEDAAAILSADSSFNRPSVMVGILAAMLEADRPVLTEYVASLVHSNPDLTRHQFNGRSLLHFAAATACLPVARILLRFGIDPNVADSGGHTPLFRAAGGRDSGEIVRELVAAGAAVNHCGGISRSTPLHEAARFGNTSAALALIELGADLNAKDKRGQTPLMRAKSFRRAKIVEMLFLVAELKHE